jgi:nitroreductase
MLISKKYDMTHRFNRDCGRCILSKAFCDFDKYQPVQIICVIHAYTGTIVSHNKPGDPMTEHNNQPKLLTEVMISRRSIRSFTTDIPPMNDVKEIIQAAILAPYGGATGMPLNEIRKIFVLSQKSEAMEKARELLLDQIKKGAKKMNILLALFPFLRKKMKPFSNRLNYLSKNGISGLSEAAYYIVVAEKKGFPPIEKQSIAHALQNMWIMATSLGIAFQLISATGMMSKNKDFMKLLGLPEGGYAIDGCVIGVSKEQPDPREKRDINDFVTWIQ